MDKQEKKILLLIKIMPVIIGILFFLCIVFMVFRNSILQRMQAIDDIKQSYLKSKKYIVKNEVKSLIKSIEYKRKLAETNLKKNLKSRVDEAYAIILNIYMQNRDKSKKKF
jgi:uncharacterized protein YlzI (FlbEa/FlbD family)